MKCFYTQIIVCFSAKIYATVKYCEDRYRLVTARSMDGATWSKFVLIFCMVHGIHSNINHRKRWFAHSKPQNHTELRVFK